MSKTCQTAHLTKVLLIIALLVGAVYAGFPVAVDALLVV